MLHTLLPLLGYLDDQHGEFLKLWIDSLGFREFPNVIKYYTIIGNGTLLKEEDTTTGNCTLLKDIDYLMHLNQPHFSEDMPNQILHMLSTLILWLKRFTLLLANILPHTISWPSHLKTYPAGNTT